LQERGKKISLSKNLKRSKTTAHWQPFVSDLEAFDFSSQEGQKAGFVSLHTEGNGYEGFQPLVEGPPEFQREAEAVIPDKESHPDASPPKDLVEKAALIEQEAYEKGFSQGEKDGFELGEKKALKLVENMQGLLADMGHMRERLLEHYEKEILALVFCQVEKIMCCSMGSEAETIEKNVIKALHAATEKSKVIIRVHPDDFDTVEKLKPNFFSEYKDLNTISVTSDSAITRGGCFLETPYGDVDATIETQLKKIGQSLQDVFNVREDA
jgi:flagellar assembly protein FliH